MIILHGDNIVESSKKLNLLIEEYKSQGHQINSFDQSELTLGRLRQELSPADLFGTTSFLIIRGLLSGAKSKSKDKIIEYLKEAKPANLLLYETKAVHASTVNQFKGATIENFKVEINIFKFLEKISPDNTTTLLSGYNDLIQKGAEPEFIFAMTVRQFRLLIQCKSSPNLLKLAPFSLRALQYQSQKFSLDNLLDSFQKLYEIERGIKTGKNPLDLNNLFLHFLEQI